jgi:DNA-binding NarL/FixJ family response regulator
MKIKIGIVDDKPGSQNILRQKLESSTQFQIVLIANDGNDFLIKMQQQPLDNMPDVVLMDLEMPNMNGIDAIASGSYLFPAVKFVVLTIFDEEEKIFNAIKAGAYGYLLKDETADKVADVLLQMYETGAGPISPGIAFKMLQLMQAPNINFTKNDHTQNTIPDFFNLTNREYEILQLLVKGLLYKQIADQLNISMNTAKKHVMNIYGKLHVRTKIQALQLLQSKGIM